MKRIILKTAIFDCSFNLDQHRKVLLQHTLYCHHIWTAKLLAMADEETLSKYLPAEHLQVIKDWLAVRELRLGMSSEELDDYDNRYWIELNS